MKTFVPDQPIKVYTSTVFTNDQQVAFDPVTVTFEVRSPDGSVFNYVNGIHSEVSKLATGSYQLLLSSGSHAEGQYRVYIKGVDAGNVLRGADSISFYVKSKPTL